MRHDAHEVVLCIQDTTELDFNGQEASGLGPLSYEEMGKRIPVRTKARFRETANDHMTMLENNPQQVIGYFQDRRAGSIAPEFHDAL